MLVGSGKNAFQYHQRFFPVEVKRMCEYFSKEELKICSANPNFCAVCLVNRYDVKVHDHVCEECSKA